MIRVVRAAAELLDHVVALRQENRIAIDRALAGFDLSETDLDDLVTACDDAAVEAADAGANAAALVAISDVVDSAWEPGEDPAALVADVRAAESSAASLFALAERLGWKLGDVEARVVELATAVDAIAGAVGVPGVDPGDLATLVETLRDRVLEC